MDQMIKKNQEKIQEIAGDGLEVDLSRVMTLKEIEIESQVEGDDEKSTKKQKIIIEYKLNESHPLRPL